MFERGKYSTVSAQERPKSSVMWLHSIRASIDPASVALSMRVQRNPGSGLSRQSAGASGPPPARIASDEELWAGALVTIGRERGYQDGWAARQFLAKFHHWPAQRFPVPRTPTVEIRNWVRSRLIAYAKARASG
jgi:hypothetical protein